MIGARRWLAAVLLVALVAGRGAAVQASDHLRWGAPRLRGVLVDHEFFVISHDNARRVPEWVTYHLVAADLRGTASRTEDFRPDPDLPPGDRAELKDYRGRPFDRGHMAPAADFGRSPRAVSETFVLSNMAPQTKRLNRGLWKTLEGQVRKLAGAHGSIWIFTGPLYLDRDGHPSTPDRFIGPDRVAVPTHFFKVILCEHASGTHEMFAFVLPNAARRIPGPTARFLTSVDDVEMLSGLDFFAALPDSEEDRLERVVQTGWPVP